MKTLPRVLATLAVFFSSANVLAASYRDLRGRLIDIDQSDVVMFWSVHDPQAMVALQHLRDMDHLGLYVVAVNTDSGIDRMRIRPFLRTAGTDVPVVLDPNGAIEDEVIISAEPGTIAVDANGRTLVRYNNIAATYPQEIRTLIADLARSR
jgi:hypothetical protein